MGDLLAELEFTLRSRKEQLTAGEEQILQTCKAKAIRGFTFGACVASGVTWAATRKLSLGHRLNYSGGAAIASGMWSFNRSLRSCAEQILELDGTRMQMVLTNIILTKYRDDPRKIRILNKHFYPEEVFVDSNPEQPFVRWRHRNAFGEISTQGMPDSALSQKTEDLESRPSTTNSPPPLSQMKQVDDVIVDPLDCIFGDVGPLEEIQNSTTGSTHTRRRHKRAHRRRQHHSEISFKV
ncbi:hypothetical protein H6P81_004884 [Aristolochia fimbriata]|uniref:Uncharacterized protein n=1 Tax=Aristolochia fimbriata TaxID=158543 RepID=A0AAV7ESX4_ARIFI|nr:hypothetical protein H6P81_004884 [Aristolochia fimbriata]